MRDHANALEAMLLYMNDTWNNLSRSTEVQDALSNGIATKPELLAAGYNSNPMRLPLYLKNGGTQWRTLIPAETQMYLAIYSSIDNTLQLGSNSSGIDNTQSSAQVAATNVPLCDELFVAIEARENVADVIHRFKAAAEAELDYRVG